MDPLDIPSVLAELVGRDAMLGATPSPDPIAQEMAAFNRVTGMSSSINLTPPSVLGPAQPTVYSLPNDMPVMDLDDDSKDEETPWWLEVGAVGQLPDEPDALRWPNAPELLYEDGPHNFLSDKHGDTTAATAVKGDIVRSPANGAWAKYSIGDADDLLTVVAGLPVWSAAIDLGWTFRIRVSADDTTGNFLDSKLTTTGAWLDKTASGAGDETLDITHKEPQGGAHAYILTLGSYIVAYDDRGHFIGRWDSKGKNWSGLNSAAEPISTTNMD